MNRPSFRATIIAAHVLWPITILIVGLICGGPAWKCAGWALCSLPWFGTVAEPVLDWKSFRSADQSTQAGVVILGFVYVLVNIRILGWAAGWWTP